VNTKQIAIFERRETPVGSIALDIFTFAMLVLCIWFSWHMGGGFWTFFTVCMFMVFLGGKWQLGPGAKHSGWVKLGCKADAIALANALPDDEVKQ
jgi:thiol:disulfide interchange protein